jgi:hypothetical protein
LENDWKNNKFFLFVSNEDIIEIVFQLHNYEENNNHNSSLINDPIVISIYMNSLLNDERITHF